MISIKQKIPPPSLDAADELHISIALIIPGFVLRHYVCQIDVEGV